MAVIRLSELQAPPEGTSVALGFFDGFHLGHQAILEAATASELRPIAFTFRNHPASVVAAERVPPLLTDFRERIELLEEAGCDVVWVDFDRPFSLLEPAAFEDELLVKHLRAARVVTGHNYRYGHKASGDAASLRNSGKFSVVTVDPVYADGELVSSTRVRALVSDGRVADAAGLLGRPFRLSSRVERGDRLGRELGVPTANLALPLEKAYPHFGIYAVWVRRGPGAPPLPAVASLGVRPTVKIQGVPLLEVHLLDFEGDLYGEQLSVDFVDWIREERKFDGLEALKQQMGRDLQSARQRLA